jgi:transaldolase
MDNNERNEIFNHVAEMLTQNGLGWIVEQVNEQIHNGKTEFIEVEKIKRRETTVDYDNKEKLGLLLDGLTQAANVLEMESTALHQIREIEPGISPEISFYSEASGATASTISAAGVAARVPVVKDCLYVINKLREENIKE